MAMAASATRFAELTDADLGLLLDNKDAASTKHVIQKSMKVFRNYCEEKETIFNDIVQLPVKGLNSIIARYYAELRKAKEYVKFTFCFVF